MTSVLLNFDKLLTSQEDISTVRNQLLDAERALGVGDLHKNSIRILQKRGARLVHSQPHLGEVVAFAISPNGKYLATGSWVTDDYERGGMLAIWDIEMGRCVNVLDPIEGGVGWPEYTKCLSWTQDSEKIGAAFNTNSIGIFDPFGSSPEALHQADVTDGWSRPPAFCLLNKGQTAFVSCWQKSKIPGLLVTFKTSTSKRLVKPAIKAMAKKIPAAMNKKLENGHLEPARQLLAATDGSKMYCINTHSFAYAITLETGKLDYIQKVGLPAAYSPEGRFLAHTLAGLVIYDGQTGLPTTDLPMHVGMNALHWAKRGESLRLAGVVSSDNEFNAEPGVHLYDDNKYRYSIDVKPRRPRWDDGELEAFAWAPSGERAAVLDEEGRLMIVRLGEKVVTEHLVPMSEGLRGVFWACPEGSSQDIIILASRSALVFVDANTGKIIADHTFMRTPEAQRPLDTGDRDLGDRMRPDPTFAIDEDTWGAAFSEGLVIAPADKTEKLDAHLAWSVDCRHAWPVRWGGLEVVASAAEAAQSALKPAGVDWKVFKPAKPSKKALAFPPPNPPTLGPLYDAVTEATAELGRGWSNHVAENLRYACVFRARRGEIEAALAMINHIPTFPERICTKLDLTALAYRAGCGHLMESEFSSIVEDIEEEINPHTELLYSIAMFSAWAAKKDAKQAHTWLTRAQAKLEPENNPWQYRLALAWALVDAGYGDEARAVFTEKAAWCREPLCFYSVPFTMALVRDGHDALLFEFLEAWKQYRFGDIDWTLRGTLASALAKHGRTARLEEGKERFGWSVDDDMLALAKSREASGMVLPTPTNADIDMLAHEFAQLQKTPRARRAGGTRGLVEKAAAVGHAGAVIMLLPDLAGNDFNHRTQAALSALWTILTGFDVAPW